MDAEKEWLEAKRKSRKPYQKNLVGTSLEKEGLPSLFLFPADLRRGKMEGHNGRL